MAVFLAKSWLQFSHTYLSSWLRRIIENDVNSFLTSFGSLSILNKGMGSITFSPLRVEASNDKNVEAFPIYIIYLVKIVFPSIYILYPYAYIIRKKKLCLMLHLFSSAFSRANLAELNGICLPAKNPTGVFGSFREVGKRKVLEAQSAKRKGMVIVKSMFVLNN